MTSELSIRSKRLYSELTAKSVELTSLLEDNTDIVSEVTASTRQLDMLLIEAKKDVNVSIWLRAGTSQHIHSNLTILEQLGIDSDNELTVNGKKVYDGSKNPEIDIPTVEGDSFWIEDENGDLVPKTKEDGSKRGIYDIAKLSSDTLIIPKTLPQGLKEGEYALSVGSLGSGADTPSAGEGLSEVTIYLGSTPYKSDANGVIALPAYPTGGSGTNDWNAIINKPTTLAGYGITDALPLSGGTLDGNNNVLNINGIDNAYIVFKRGWIDKGSVGYYNNFAYVANETTYARIGVTDNGEPQYWPDYTGNTKHTLIHTGNIGSQSVNYANSAGNADVLVKTYSNSNINIKDDVVKLISSVSGDSQANGFPNQYVSGLSVLTSYVGWQMVSYGGDVQNPYFRSYQDNGTWKQWRQLAFLDDNVASATKLQTARTIWGQSFDGTGDITKPAKMQYIEFANVGGNAVGYVGKGASTEDAMYLGTYGGSNVYLFSHYLSNSLILTSNGNVLIGTTSDNGYKLAVNGGALANTVRTQELRLGEAVLGSDITKNKWYYASIGYEYTDTSPNTLKPDIVFKTMYDTYAEGSGVERMRIKSNGNVLIGTTTNNGAKLQVYGNISASGYQLPTAPPSNPVSGGYYLYVGTLGAGAVIS